MINTFEQVAELYKLKSIRRDTLVDGNKESTAEHCWSMIILADYFISAFKYKLNRERVYQLITYHDILEVKIGDIPLKDTESRKNKTQSEHTALVELATELPKNYYDFIKDVVDEYEERKSIESKFVKAVDCVDADLNCLAYGYSYAKHGYNRAFLLEKFENHLKPFPEIVDFYNQLLDFLQIRGDLT